MEKRVKKKSSKELDRDALMEEDISVFATIGFALLFIFVGIVLGYILYKLALDSSAMIVVNKF